MDRTLTARSPLAAAAAVLSALGLLIALTGPGLTPAAADQFIPIEDPPAINILVSSDDLSTGTEDAAAEIYSGDAGSLNVGDYTALNATSASIEPSYTTSTTTYNVFAELTTNGDLQNVNEIRLCLYDSADAAFSGGDASANETAIAGVCGIGASDSTTAALSTAPATWTDGSNADFDPKKVMVMRWLDDVGSSSSTVTTGNPGFFIEDGAGAGDQALNYRVATSDWSPGTPDQSQIVRFSFTVSNAMQVSSSWKIRIAAQSSVTVDTITTVQSASDVPATTFTVGYFGYMSADGDNSGTTQRPMVDFGQLIPGTTDKDNNDILTGHYTANDASNLTIRGTDFVYNDGSVDHTIALATNGDFDFSDNADRASIDYGYGVPTDDAETLLNVPQEKASLDCAFVPSATVATNVESFVQVQNDPRIFAADETVITATGEALKTDLDNHTCFLTYRGAAPVANQTYSNDVVIGIIQDAGGALGSGGITGEAEPATLPTDLP